MSNDIRIISAQEITNSLYKKILKCLTDVEAAADGLIRCAEKTETGAAKWALKQIIDNNVAARRDNTPACQDTGLCVFFVEIGNRVIVDGDLEKAINGAAESAYKDGYFRQSIAGAIDRKNTKTNTPAIIHYKYVTGSNLKISFLAKGAGSENMSALYMLTPSKSRQGIIDSAVDCVLKAGANPCPPIVIGVGVGGNMEYSCMLAKHALLRTTGEPSPDPEIALLEQDILSAVNALNIGAQGFGGKTTALSVAVETFPTHIGMLPVAINLQCHSVRHFEITL